MSDSVISIGDLNDAQGSIETISQSTPANIDLAMTQMDQLSHQLREFLEIGGPVVWLLLLFSCVALSMIIFKWLQFLTLRLEKHDDIEKSLRAWEAGQIAQAEKQLRFSEPVACIVRHAQQICCDSFSHSDQDQPASLETRQRYQDELAREANALMFRIRSLLRPLEIIASLSPLLGLLGTVLGMIEAFHQMELAGSQVDPAVLSGGIWQALLTTAVGLAVAIPVVMAHGYFERKAERVAFYLNDAVTRVFTKGPIALLASQSEFHGIAHAA